MEPCFESVVSLPLFYNDPYKLDTQETSAQKKFYGTFRDHRTQGMQYLVKAAREMYELVDDKLGKRYTATFDSCRSSAWFARHSKTGAVRVISNSCHLRWCPICTDAKRGYIAGNITEFLNKTKYAKLLTLTLKNSDNDISSEVERLYDCFRELRRLKFFRTAITGGIWFFQIKKSKDGKTWHPHIHCVVTGYYLNRKYISKAWLRITGDSHVVDLRMIKDNESSSKHIARYASCPCDLSALELDDRVAIFQAMHNRRICGTWGKCRGVTLKPVKPDDADCWKNIGSWSFITNSLDSFDDSKAIFNAWKNKEILPENIDVSSIELEVSTGIPPPKPLIDAQYNLDFFNS